MATRKHGNTGVIAKLLLQNLIWIVALGALLFVPAGRCTGRRPGYS